MRSRGRALATAALAAALLAAGGPAALRSAPAAPANPANPAISGGVERAMYGGTAARNMVSDETHLPVRWDPATGENVKWVADLGSQSYGGPVVAGGKVFVGTNNQKQRDPKIAGDRGILMAFRAADGQFLWQAVHEKLSQGKVNDWPLQGICSTPAIEGNRLYYVSNRAELVCADTEGTRGEAGGGAAGAGGAAGGGGGAAAGAAGVRRDSGGGVAGTGGGGAAGTGGGGAAANAAGARGDASGVAAAAGGGTAARLVWKLDMIGELGVYPHNQAASSPLVIDDLVYVVTGNGVDEGHVNIPSPRAPSFLAADKRTGKVVWQSSLPGPKILHGQWSSPSYGILDGKPQVLFPGGDGWLYALEPKTGKVIWRFDCNPKDSVYTIGPGSTRNNLLAMAVIVGDMVYIAVGEDPEHGEGIGHLWALRPHGEGDLTGKAVVWHRDGEEFHRSLSTVAVRDGLLFTADFSGYVYCLDARTGKPNWVYNSYGAIWGSPLVADGKVYIGNEDGDVAVLRAAPRLEVLSKVNMGSAVFSTPVARDGVLYITSRSQLFALADGVPAHKQAAGASASTGAAPPR